MAITDRGVSLHPYFKVADGKMGEFRALCERFMEATAREPKCLYYGFSFCGDEAHCREGYADAEGLLAHLDNVGAILEEALKIAEVARLEVHGTEEELAKLREPLGALGTTFFVMEYGFRR